jgi:putative flippase GtrA
LHYLDLLSSPDRWNCQGDLAILMTIALRYAIFSAIAMATNVGSQMLSMVVYNGAYAVELSILVGTIIGMPVRYLLEKRFIFYFQAKNIRMHGQVFLLYVGMSVITTGVFWATEYAFHLIFDSDGMRYFGAIVGLTIGSFAKYQLDKKYVFTNARSRNPV